MESSTLLIKIEAMNKDSNNGMLISSKSASNLGGNNGAVLALSAGLKIG